MDTQQQLFALMAVAEEHQKAVQTAIDSLAKERAALSQAAASMVNVADQVKKSAADAIPAIRKAAGEAVSSSMANSIDRASDAVVTAMKKAVEPVVKGLSGAVQAASAAESQLKNASKWFAWKLIAVAASGIAGVCLVGFVLVGWQMHQVDTLKTEIVQLTVNAEEWKKRAGKSELSTCGEQKRTCVRVDKAAGSFGLDGNQYMVLNGY